MSSLDTQALIAFIAVAETESFSEAAETLFLTQPAVSKRVASLEATLNTLLFDRIRRRVFLTESGRTLLPRAKKIIQDIEDAKQAIVDQAGTISGNLTIAFSHHIGLHRLPPYLKAFSEQHPEVTLDFKFLDSEQAYEKILRGESELAVITLSPDKNKEVIATPLWQDKLIFACSPEHPLHLQDNVSLKQLSQYPAILPGNNTYTGQIVRQLFETQNIKLQASMTTNYLETIKMMVSIGLGWSLLPKTISKSLEEIHVPDVYIDRQLGVIQYKDRLLSNAATAFKKMLIEG